MPDVAAPDSGRNEDDPAGALWEQLASADQSSNARAYAAAQIAIRIMETRDLKVKAFAEEARTRRIPYFGSQASVSRRLRWARLHDELWEAAILPRGAFISEAASRPLFDGRLTGSQRLALLADLFSPFLTDDEKRRLAEEISEAKMREHLARHGEGPGQYRAPRTLNPEKVIARLLAQGMTASAIGELAQQIEKSARDSSRKGAA